MEQETILEIVGSIRTDVRDIKAKVDGWPDKCEAHRGVIHERINKIHWWIIGTCVTVGGIFLTVILRAVT